jgi:hypothetical protein
MSRRSHQAVTREKVAEISVDFMTTFLPRTGGRAGEAGKQEFRTNPVPFWLVCSLDTIKGPMRQMFFVVFAVGRDGCCAKRGEKPLIVVADAVTRWIVSSAQRLTER